MGSKYMLAEGTTLQMSKEEVKDTSGNIATGATPVTYVDLADTTKTIDYSGESTDEVDVTTLVNFPSPAIMCQATTAKRRSSKRQKIRNCAYLRLSSLTTRFSL